MGTPWGLGRPGAGDEADEQAMLELQIRVGDIYQEADIIAAEARYDHLAERLATPNC